MNAPEMPANIEVGKVFEINKGGRKARYKIIPHPYFDDAYALIEDYEYLGCNALSHLDRKHIINASKTIEGAWKHAYNHT
jgi:hypothetical protein